MVICDKCGGSPAEPAVTASVSGSVLCAACAAEPAEKDLVQELPRPQLTPEVPPLPPGYTLRAFIGRGGMGIVCRARQESLDRDVALKFLAPIRKSAPNLLSRFRREAKALARLAHPHIVVIHDVLVDDTRACMVMEYVEGETLAALLARERPPLPQVAAVMQAVFDACACAHRAGVIHRDLKPANILIAADGTPKVADFGLAQIIGDASEPDHLTSPGLIAGTFEYMAPEQRDGLRSVDHRTDLYALGLILFEMLTGRRPAACERPLRETMPTLPAAVDELLAKLLAQDPERRPASADEAANAFRRAFAPTRAAERVLLMTVGTGPGVPEALALSITSANPARVIFFGTTESRRNADLCSEVLIGQGTNIPGEFRQLADSNDLQAGFTLISAVISALRSAGTADKDIIADYTSGTKAMSVALTMAAAAIAPACSFRYIGGNVRDGEYGRVLAGEEDIRARVSPAHAAAVYEMRFAGDLFAAGEYAGAAYLLAAALKPGVTAKVEAELAVLLCIAGSFRDWDAGDHAAAAQALSAVTPEALAARTDCSLAQAKALKALLEALSQSHENPTPLAVADAYNRWRRRGSKGRAERELSLTTLARLLSASLPEALGAEEEGIEPLVAAYAAGPEVANSGMPFADLCRRLSFPERLHPPLRHDSSPV